MNVDPALTLAEHVCRTTFADLPNAALETTSPSGSPEKPLSDAQLHAKFRDCAAHAMRPISQEVIEQAIQLINHLDNQVDATALVRLFA